VMFMWPSPVLKTLQCIFVNCLSMSQAETRAVTEPSSKRRFRERRMNMRRFLPTALIAIAMGVGSLHAQEVIVKVHPPREVVETRVAAPGPGYVWIGGYHQWNGNAYAWTPGRWELPPRPHAVWVRHRWVHRHGGWVLAEGHWK
jgi:hypothetical protein